MEHNAKISKVVYAVDKEGNYKGVNSVGWEPENYALRQAWEDIDERLAAAEADVRKGTASPIAFFMLKNLMDLPLLARYTGKWQWQVRRHLRPDVFSRLPQAALSKYASVFNISVDELVHFGKG